MPRSRCDHARVVGWIARDVILTRDELIGLSSNLLESHEPPRGTTRLTDWLAGNRAAVGAAYASELDRHYRQPAVAR